MPLSAAVQFDDAVPQLVFAADHVQQALGDAQATVSLQVQAQPDQPEAFTIQVSGGNISVVGTDAAGAMYGGLEVAEQIRIGGASSVQPGSQAPAMGMRGIKFNIPLDARTPSYTDMGDAAQHNIPHMWDMDFWQAFIDEAASHRYNYISLWSLHPFPSLVKVPEYPEVALDDVKRAVNLSREHYSGRGEDFDREEIIGELETLKTITMDEKIEFWRAVMAYGKSRNVDFYVVTWNIFDYGTEGKYGITDTPDNETTIDYFRKSVIALFLTYPDLRGIGITTGEHMHDMSSQEKEDWMIKTYGAGVMDVVAEQPDRKITFLHRQHQAGADEIAETFQDLLDHPNIEFLFSFKYAKAHSYSATRQPYHDKFLRDLRDHEGDLKTIWTMRNDSTYWFRWAAPDFLREFVGNIPMEKTRGYYFGSDGWVWGREYIRKDVDGPRELELQKHWMQWLLWGRFAYDPQLSNERLIGIVHSRFPSVDAKQLFDAWQKASMTYPITTGFHWGALDYHWFPEACVGLRGGKGGFHGSESFIKLKPHNRSGYTSISEYVRTIQGGKEFTETGPFEVAQLLFENADSALSTVASMNPGDHWELQETLADIEAMALLGRYYGHMITGATYLRMFRELKDAGYQTKSVAALEQAAETWRSYLANVQARYIDSQWLARIRSGVVELDEMTEFLEKDIESVRTETLD